MTSKESTEKKEGYQLPFQVTATVLQVSEKILTPLILHEPTSLQLISVMTFSNILYFLNFPFLEKNP